MKPFCTCVHGCVFVSLFVFYFNTQHTPENPYQEQRPMRSQFNTQPTQQQAQHKQNTTNQIKQATRTQSTIKKHNKQTERTNLSQAMWFGCKCTSGTSCVFCSTHAVPHTPLPNGMRTTAGKPLNGPVLCCFLSVVRIHSHAEKQTKRKELKAHENTQINTNTRTKTQENTQKHTHTHTYIPTCSTNRCSVPGAPVTG